MTAQPTLIEPGTLLIADDDEQCRQGLAALLRREGYKCDCAADGASALKCLREVSYDALICDIHMPGNDDLELIRRIPQVASGLPILLLTGQPSMETAAHSVRLPVVAYLVKPPDLDEIRDLLHISIGNYRRFQSIASHRRRLQEWDRELEQIEVLLRGHSVAVMPEVVATVLAVSWRNLAASLADMKSLTDILSGHLAAESAQELREAKPLVLVEAIRETIGVLEKTKGVFKSKELAELRRKLEALINRP